MHLRTRSAAAAALATLLVAGATALSQPAAAAASSAASPSRAVSVIDLDELVLRAQRTGRARAARAGRDEAAARAREARGAWWPRARLNLAAGPSPDLSCVDPACTTTSPEEATLAFDGVYGAAELEIIQP